MAYAAISKPSLYMNPKLTTGTGSSQAVTGLGFQPDLLWGKRRDSTGNNSLFDAVRGITKGIESNSTGAEWTSTDYYSSFDSDGFTIAAGSSGAGNGSAQTAVQWCWKAGGTGSANTDGDIASTVSVNTTAGFSIVTWTVPASGSGTVGHGLGAIPKMIISKSTSDATDWEVHHASLANTQTIQLNTTTAVGTNNAYNDTDPTSSVFSVTASGFGASRTMVSYCFAEIKGYSSIGSYIGNGSSDGTFVYTGLKPAFILQKQSTGTGDWNIFDNKRSGANGANPGGNHYLMPNSNLAETVNERIDFLSNGFKLKTTNTAWNGSGETYIFMAVASEPLVANVGGSIPATAR